MAIKIFIAENSLPLRERLVNLIEESGKMKVIGQTGCVAQVQPQIGSLAPDVALLDIHLQGGSAFDILGRLRQAEPTLGIVVMTANGHPGYRKKAQRLGADCFIDKGYGSETIVPTLLELGQRRKAQ